VGHRLPRGAGAPDDGIFAGWRWDGNTLTAANDRYGMYPVFVAARGPAVWLSPSIVTLLREGAPCEFDENGLAVFFRLGFFVGNDTAFRDIKALPPDARLEWRRGVLRVEGRETRRPAAAMGRDAALDAYIEPFRQAIGRRLPPANDGVALPLSGGRDSRHILLELCRQGRPPALCVTARHYPPYPDEDARVAARLTAAVGVRHVIVEQGERFDAELAKNRVTSFGTAMHAWTMALAGSLRGGGTTLFDGIGGDVLSAGLFLTPERQALCDAGRFEELAERLLPASNERTLPLLLRPEVRARTTRSRAVDRIAAELTRHADAANPIGSFAFWNRTRRAIGLVPYAVLSRLGTVFAPHLDHDLYDFLASLPVGLVLDHRLHTDAIRRAYPAYAGVPYQDNRVRGPDPWAARRGFLRRLVAYARARRAAPAPLTRLSYPLVAGAALLHRVRDVRPLLNPELTLFLLQLQSLAEHTRDDAAPDVAG
jgi:hypothetical protein